MGGNDGMADVRKLQERISNQSNRPDRKWNEASLFIGRIPPQTKKAFEELAERDFCDDKGWLLKWLMDDMMSADTRIIYEQLAELTERIEKLENGASVKGEPQTKEIRMGSGKIINVACQKKEEGV